MPGCIDLCDPCCGGGGSDRLVSGGGPPLPEPPLGIMSRGPGPCPWLWLPPIPGGPLPTIGPPGGGPNSPTVNDGTPEVPPPRGGLDCRDGRLLDCASN